MLIFEATTAVATHSSNIFYSSVEKNRVIASPIGYSLNASLGWTADSSWKSLRRQLLVQSV